MKNDPALVEQIFTAAKQRTNHAERHAFLNEACGDNASMWNEVWDRLRSLPASDPGPGKQGKSRAMNTAKLNHGRRVTEKPGDMAGPYSLVQILDESAGSVVWMAERGGQKSECVEVRIMVVEAVDEFLTRYEAQKHALALLDHAGIARPHGSGKTTAGNAFLVSEFAHGEPLLKFCNDQKLSLAARVRLFAQACEALHHAHQKGVIHGDLKPANLLAKWGPNGEPVLKITGFGVAEALKHAPAIPGGGLRMPAAWFSPEQLSAGTIDARSDIYAMGALLYELLTDRPPLAMPKETADQLAEIRRVACEVEPRRPSECLAALPKAPLAGIALSRRTEAAEFVALVERYFDGMVTRMLNKHPQQRPSNAGTLAGELEPFLSTAEKKEVEEKQQQTKAAATESFFSEHRSLFTLAGAILGLLAAGMLIAGWLLVRERQEDSRANALKKSESHSMTAQFLQRIFTSLTPEKAKGHDTSLLNNILDEAVGNLDKLAGHPEAGARAQETIGLTYLALSQPADAQKQLEGALDKRSLALGGSHRDTLRTMKDLAIALKEQGKHEESERVLRRALHGQRQTLGAEHPDTLVTISVLAAVCDAQEKHVEAEQLFLQLYQVQKRVLGPDHLETLSTIGNLASSFTAQGRHAEALKLREEQLEATQRTLGASDPKTLVTMNITAQAAEAGGMPAEAEKLYFGALEIMKHTLGMEHPETLEQMDRAASMLGRQGRHEEAVKLYQHAFDARSRTLGGSHPQTLRSMQQLATAFDAAGKQAEAEALQLQTLEAMKTAYGPGDPDVLAQMRTVALMHGRHGKHEQAVDLLRQMLQIQQRALGPEHAETLDTLACLGEACLHAGQWKEAEALLRESLVLQVKLSPSHWRRFDMESLLGAALLEQNKLAEAEPLLRSGHEGLIALGAKLPEDARPCLQHALERLTRLTAKTANTGKIPPP